MLANAVPVFSSDMKLLQERTECRSFVVNRDNSLFETFSNLDKLVLFTAYARRFVENSLAKFRNVGYIFSVERKNALNGLIKIAQLDDFGDEYFRLSNDKEVAKK